MTPTELIATMPDIREDPALKCWHEKPFSACVEAMACVATCLMHDDREQALKTLCEQLTANHYCRVTVVQMLMLAHQIITHTHPEAHGGENGPAAGPDQHARA